MRRARRRSMLARPPIWRFTVFGREIRPSVCPFDHGSAMAAEIASRSPATPRAKAPTGEDKAVCSQASSRAGSRPRIRAWKPSTASRAATSRGTARSTVATITASARLSLSRASVSSRASARGAGQRVGWALASSRRRRVAHSVTTRRDPAKPAARRRRQSSAPLREPSAHSAFRRSSHGSSELARGRNGSAPPPRATSRTSFRERPVRRTISLIGTPAACSARTAASASTRCVQPSCCSRSAAVRVAGSATPAPSARLIPARERSDSAEGFPRDLIRDSVHQGRETEARWVERSRSGTI